MQEKREFVRINLPLKLKYRPLDFKSTDKEATSRDISAGGISIYAASILEHEKELSLDIALPDDLGHLYAQARVAWLNLTEENHLAGLKFSRLSAFDRSRLISFINLEKQKEYISQRQSAGEITFFKDTPLKDKAEIMELMLVNLECLEPGLKLVDKNIDFSEGGTLDILAIDYTNTLVLMELLPKEQEEVLIVALKHFEWVIRHLSVLKKIYALPIELSSIPRIIIIAPRFTDSFKRLTENIHPARIELFEYRCLETQGTRGLFLNKLTSARAKENIAQEIVSSEQEAINNLNSQQHKFLHWLRRR